MGKELSHCTSLPKRKNNPRICNPSLCTLAKKLLLTVEGKLTTCEQITAGRARKAFTWLLLSHFRCNNWPVRMNSEMTAPVNVKVTKCEDEIEYILPFVQ